MHCRRPILANAHVKSAAIQLFLRIFWKFLLLVFDKLISQCIDLYSQHAMSLLLFVIPLHRKPSGAAAWPRDACYARRRTRMLTIVIDWKIFFIHTPVVFHRSTASSPLPEFAMSDLRLALRNSALNNYFHFQVLQGRLALDTTGWRCSSD